MLKKKTPRKREPKPNPLEARIAALEAQVDLLARAAFGGPVPVGGGLAPHNLGALASVLDSVEKEEPPSIDETLRISWARRMSDVYGDTWTPPQESSAEEPASE